jgi:hypothetical protein
MTNRLKQDKKDFFTSEGEINFYASKSHSKHALKNEFEIQTTLEAYNIDISLYRKNLNNDKGVIQAQFAPHIQFTGNLLEFDFMDLSPNESTVILHGTLKILNNKKQKTFLGTIKKIGNTIYLNSNFILDISEFNFDKIFHCTVLNDAKRIRIELEIQLN